jgi:putative SOS response-associated peptidase YedK
MISRYDFLQKDLQIGFDYSLNAVLKRQADKEDFDIVKMEWGFIPSYPRTREDVAKMRTGYKDANGKFKQPYHMLNAVCEELLLPGKTYREAALKRRCLVLSTGFFEWRHIYPLNKKTGLPLKTSNKYPYYISLKDKGYFFIAGIWQPWTDKETGEYAETFAIVTTKANALMMQVHNSKNRMPTILNEDLAYEWLFGNLDEKTILEIAATQYPSSEMQACTIAKDFREALEPTKEFLYDEVPALELNL